MTMRGGRYRLRTSLRARLPAALAGLLPKGRRDCGAHEWYRSDQGTWRCYHCEPAITHVSPWTREEQLRHALGGISCTLRLLALGDGPGSEQELGELRRLVGEALSALPEEERRLERLAQAPVADLPAIAHALQAT